MPVTARLSRKFYDQFGDDIANELVEWFNKVDETYRLELRHLNELNFSRFDAKLEQRVSEIRADMAAMRSGLREEMGEMASALRVEMSEMRSALREEMVEMRSGLREEMGKMCVGLRAEIAELGQRLGDRIAAIEVGNARGRETQMRWMVGMWIAQMSMFVGTIFIVLQGR